MSAKDDLHKLVDELTEREALRARVVIEDERFAERQRRKIEREIADGYERIPTTPEEDAWALANAREAIREEPW